MSVTTKVQTDVINGDLEVNGDLTVTGEMTGDAISRTVTVAEESRVVGVKVSNDFQSLLSSLASDDILTPAEKKEVNRAWRVIYAEKPVLLTRASGYGYTAGNTYVDALTTAYDALAAYLFTSPGPLNDLTTESSIDGTTMLGLFDDYYDAREDILAFLGALNGGNVSILIDGVSLPSPGGLCDGTSDQTEINAAITAVSGAGGGSVRLGAGTYYVNGTIFLDDNVALVMEEGTIIQSSDTVDAIIKIAGKSNVQIIGGTITRSSFTSSTDPDIMVYFNSENIKIENVNFNCGYETIQVVLTHGIIINKCRFELPSGSSIGYVLEINSSTDAVVQNCTVQGNSADVNEAILTADTIGDGQLRILDNVFMDIVADAATYGMISLWTQAAIISRNVFSGIHGASIKVIYMYGADGTQIIENTFYDIYAWNDRAVGIYISNGSDNIIIKNNKLTDVAGYAIYDENGFGENTGEVIANVCRDNGQLIDRGGCESTTPPMIFGETVPYTAGQTSYARSSDQAYEGAYSYKITKATAAGSTAVFDLVDNNTNTDMHGLIPGLEYTFEMQIYIPSSGGPLYSEVLLWLYDYDSGWATSSQAAANTYDAWQTVTVTRTLRSTATGAIARVRFEGGASNGEYIYIDNIRLYPTGTNNEHENQYKES